MFKLICKKATVFILALSCIIVFATSCSKQQNVTGSTDTSKEIALSANDHPHVQIEMENGDKMVLQLYPEFAPETVNNFVNLAKAGFYDGLTFHRIIKGFMIQGGDPKGNGTGGADKNIKGEFIENGFSKNALSHVRGVISMARGGDPDSASSQFFIMHAANAGLDGKYAAFGVIVSGEDILDKIANTPVTANDSQPPEISKPTKTVKIKSVTVLNK
jgi:peptidyl-prolyl cis-trans isomerase B (cyclophilin B)